MEKFNAHGIHVITGTKYDKEGYNLYGFDKTGFDRQGFNKKGWSKKFKNKHTGSLYDVEGYDIRGFNNKGVHKVTQTLFNPAGFDVFGYNNKGLDKRNFDRTGLHVMTRTTCDPWGFDKNGHNVDTGTNTCVNGYRRIDLIGLELIKSLICKGLLFFKKKPVKDAFTRYNKVTQKYYAIVVLESGKDLKIKRSSHKYIATRYLRHALLKPLGYIGRPWGYVLANPKKTGYINS